MMRYFEKRMIRREFFAPLDETEEGTSENTIAMLGASKRLDQLDQQLRGFLCPATTRKTPDDFFVPHGSSEPSCMQLSLSVLSVNENYSSPTTISVQQVSIASLEAEEVSLCDLSRSSIIMSMDNLLDNLKQIQDEESKDTGCETKKHKKKDKQKSKKQIKSTDPYQASSSHHHHHGQDQARPRRAVSTGLGASEPLRKVHKIPPSPAEQRKRSKSLPQKTPPRAAQNVVNHRRGTMDTNKTGRDHVISIKKKKHKKKRKLPKKTLTSTKPSEASTSHHHGQDQDRARPRDDSMIQQQLN